MWVILGLFFALSGAAAHELPKRYDIQNVPLASVPMTRNLQIQARVKLPKGYKATHRAVLNLYEKHPGGWVLSQKVPQRQKSLTLFDASQDVVFEKNIVVSAPDKDLAFDLSVSFCQKICVINNFQGIAKRSRQAKSHRLAFEVEGQLPEQRLKKKKPTSKVSLIDSGAVFFATSTTL